MNRGIKYLPDLGTMEYHPKSAKLVDIICNKTQNDNKLFFHVLVGYYFSVMSSCMRANIQAPVLRGPVRTPLSAAPGR